MASIAMLGFVKGASKRGLDIIDAREEEERDKRKMEAIAKLQREQMDYKLDFEENKAIAESVYDPASKKVRNVSKSGKVLGELDARPDQISSYEAAQLDARRKDEMEDANLGYKRAQTTSLGIRDSLDAQRTASTVSRNSAATGAYNRQGGKTLDGASVQATDGERAKELAYQYKDVIDEAVATGNISRGAIQQAAIEVIKNSPDGEAARSSFLNFLSDYKAGRKKTDQFGRKPLESSNRRSK